MIAVNAKPPIPLSEDLVFRPVGTYQLYDSQQKEVTIHSPSSMRNVTLCVPCITQNDVYHKSTIIRQITDNIIAKPYTSCTTLMATQHKYALDESNIKHWNGLYIL